jgi:hypothetical protein
MTALVDAVDRGDLEGVKRLVGEGADIKERLYGETALLRAAVSGNIPIMHWLLTEGGSSLDEQAVHGGHALSIAAYFGNFGAMQWLLEVQGASMTESDDLGRTVWGAFYHHGRGVGSAAELSSLLKVMVMLEDAPPFFVAKLSPAHADICTRGRQLRAQLPSYLEQQRTAVIAHCPMPGVLQAVVATYAATTSEDMWADGLCV